jgi:hypothetical protein
MVSSMKELLQLPTLAVTSPCSLPRFSMTPLSALSSQSQLLLPWKHQYKSKKKPRRVQKVVKEVPQKKNSEPWNTAY